MRRKAPERDPASATGAKAAAWAEQECKARSFEVKDRGSSGWSWQFLISAGCSRFTALLLLWCSGLLRKQEGRLRKEQHYRQHNFVNTRERERKTMVLFGGYVFTQTACVDEKPCYSHANFWNLVLHLNIDSEHFVLVQIYSVTYYILLLWFDMPCVSTVAWCQCFPG